MNSETNEGQGGSYVVRPGGERELVERTADHPDGSRPRDANERPIGNDGRAIEVASEPDAAAAADASKRRDSADA